MIARWKKRNAKKDTDRTARAFVVPAEEIRENKYDLSINRYKEVAYEEVEYEAPLSIIASLRAIEREIAAELAELEELVENDVP